MEEVSMTLKSPEEIALPPSPPEFADAIVTNHRHQPQNPNSLQLRPENPRRSTDPIPSLDDGTTKISTLITPGLPSRARNHSPYSRSHYRSRSSASLTMGAPLMARAHSSPGMDSTGRILNPSNVRPSSPLGLSPVRRRSPLRMATEDSFPTSFAQSNLAASQTATEYSPQDSTPSIPEHSELPTTPSSPMLPPIIHNTFPRSRRRPSSPLHHVASAPSFSTATVNTSPSPISSQSSPVIQPTKFNEPYPYSYSFSSSSMPSTPTSMRSRSPSISSLETIPDDRDAEEAALAREAEQIQLNATAEDDDFKDGPLEGRRRTSLDVPGRGGSNSKRKRWSVCGAERRGDLDLETIWED